MVSGSLSNSQALQVKLYVVCLIFVSITSFLSVTLRDRLLQPPTAKSISLQLTSPTNTQADNFLSMSSTNTPTVSTKNMTQLLRIQDMDLNATLSFYGANYTLQKAEYTDSSSFPSQVATVHLNLAVTYLEESPQLMSHEGLLMTW
jgi:hypothetical protein